jgi:high frequency lysogenization protein
VSRYTDTDRTLAFTGTYQAARLVHDLASTGQCDEKAFRITLDSLFVTQPEKVLDVWGGELENLRIGIETVVSQMMGSSRNLYITLYVLGLVVLAG